MRVIDAHTHILPPAIVAARAGYMARDRWFGLLHASPRTRLATAEDLVRSMDAAEIEGSVAFGFAFAETETCRLCNEHVLEAAARWPGRILPFAVVNPAEGAPALAEARRCLEAGALGLGELMPDGQGYGLQDPCLDDLMDLASAHGAPVMVHVNELVGHPYPGKGTAGPHDAYALACRFPQVRFIFAHWGGGLPFYELMPTARKGLANVYYDTAASLYLYDDRIFAEVARWAPDKLLFATDYPLIGQCRFLERVLQAGLAPEALERLLSGNLMRVLGGYEQGGDR
jgi:hypothetical protein